MTLFNIGLVPHSTMTDEFSEYIIMISYVWNYISAYVFRAFFTYYYKYI